MALTPKGIVLPHVPCDGDADAIVDRHGEAIFSAEFYKDFYKKRQEDRNAEWQQTVSAYEENPDDFYNSWHYLNEHPAFWKFYGGPSSPRPLPLAERLHERNIIEDYGIHHCVDISIVKVDPGIGGMNTENPAKNTATEVWIELGKQPWPKEPDPNDPHNAEYGDVHYHDHYLDDGGPTVEAAIITAARNVWNVYGNDRRICDNPQDPYTWGTSGGAELTNDLIKDLADEAEKGYDPHSRDDPRTTALTEADVVLFIKEE